MRKLSEAIKSIHCTNDKSFALTFSGKVFCYTENKYLNCDIQGEKIIELFVDNDCGSSMFCQTFDFCYERYIHEKWTKISKNLFEYIFFGYRFTYKTIHLKNTEIYSIDFCLNEKSNEVKKNLKIIDFIESKSSVIIKDLSNFSLDLNIY